VLQWQQHQLHVLLIQRGHEPFAGQWALPGGFVDMEEPLEAAARRELQEETGVTDVPLREVGMAGKPGRDPRGRTISAIAR
jgi:8-oxo-dGTP diphosphatase